MAALEHVNFTVSDPKATAKMLIVIFDWHIRWEGAALGGAGYTVHVGTDAGYVAVYSGSNPNQTVPKADASYATRGGLNHIGVVVDDIAATEAKVKAMGLTPHSHADYEPGERCYFHDPDGIEIEVVSYA
jgi:catechol 2,3-dioxygenase-like lactoylglutathione lyase family enzyme